MKTLSALLMSLPTIFLFKENKKQTSPFSARTGLYHFTALKGKARPRMSAQPAGSTSTNGTARTGFKPLSQPLMLFLPPKIKH